jgi:hypothetical protein
VVDYRVALRIAAQVAVFMRSAVIFWSRIDLLELFRSFRFPFAAMAPRSRSPRGGASEIAALRAALAAAETALRAEHARAAAMEARWLSAYQEVVDDARALAALARGAGAAGDVVDEWFVPPPVAAEPEEEPDTQ